MIAYNTTSTGTSSVVTFKAPVTRIAVQPTGACSYSVQGSLTGDTWFTVVASSTSAAGTIKTSTGNLLVTQARLVFTAIGTTSFVAEVVGA